MKLGINTNIDYSNYGNRLQNYALQIVLESMGNEVITIKNYTNKPVSKIRKIKNSVENGTLIKKIFKKINLKINSSRTSNSDVIRRKKFLQFTKKYINESSFVLDENTKDFSFDQQIDCYIIGSDQVWNYNFGSRFSTYDFVEYSNKPKISYAASFGVESIPESYFKFYRNGLLGIDYISVRELEGKKLVKDISGRDSTVVLDPTLLISRDDWLKIVPKRFEIKENYVLTYFLGTLSAEDEAYIKRFADLRNLKTINLGNSKYKELWESDPSDFVGLFSQADAIFTDSFHGSVFSIVFNKYFEVFVRNDAVQSMNSRLSTLLTTLQLTSCWHSSGTKHKKINYSIVNKILKEKREYSLAFLKNSLAQVKVRAKE